MQTYDLRTERPIFHVKGLNEAVMSVVETLAVGKIEGAERWLEIGIDEDGGCSISIVGATDASATLAVFSCSLDTLRMIAKGMSYQASSGEGYVTITQARNSVYFSGRRKGDRDTWLFQMPVEEFEEAVKKFEEIAARLKRGYAA
jgi:hypothetical protein